MNVALDMLDDKSYDLRANVNKKPPRGKPPIRTAPPLYYPAISSEAEPDLKYWVTLNN